MHLGQFFTANQNVPFCELRNLFDILRTL